MNIIVSKYRGFCNGVTNAVNSAVKTLEENEKGTVFSYGEMVHNKTVIEKLDRLGLKVFSSVLNRPKSWVVTALRPRFSIIAKNIR